MDAQGDAAAAEMSQGRRRSLAWVMYCFVSVFAAFVAVHHALESREQFFSAMTYLVTNKVNVAVRQIYETNG